MHIDESYLQLVEHILQNGERKSNRTGIDTISVFGPPSLRADLREGFPLLTTKKVDYEAVKAELLWFLSGSTNVNDLPKKYQFIWRPWAKENGGLGPIYGKQWVNWEHYIPDYDNQEMDGYGKYITPYKIKSINQIQKAIDTIKTNPDSRRILVSAWNVAELNEMSLVPCHYSFSFNVSKPYLDLSFIMRSYDLLIGAPFNLASYGTLLAMIAKECKLVPRYLVNHINDGHIYVNQIENVHKQLERKPYPLPTIEIVDKPFWDLRSEDIQLLNYQSHPFIRYPVAV